MQARQIRVQVFGFVLIKIRVKSQDVEEPVCINKLAMLLTWLLDLNLLISFVLR